MANARLKTWSALSDLRRMPTEYEVVTHRLHYHTEMPFELDPDAPVVAWYRKYRDDIGLSVSDWNRFRDPRAMVYRKYTEHQDDRETFIDVLYEESESLTLSGEWVAYLATYLGVLRYLFHGTQMLAAYQAQLAPSSYITNCLIFEAGDEMRKVQRIAYHQAVLRKAYPEWAWDSDREVWETDPRLAPLRELIEQLLVTYAWDEAWAAVQLVVKPVIDRLWLVHWATLARLNADNLLADILSNLYLDTLRHQEWSEALRQFIVDENPANQDRLNVIQSVWAPRTENTVAGIRAVFEEAPVSFDYGTVQADLMYSGQ